MKNIDRDLALQIVAMIRENVGDSDFISVTMNCSALENLLKVKPRGRPVGWRKPKEVDEYVKQNMLLGECHVSMYDNEVIEEAN